MPGGFLGFLGGVYLNVAQGVGGWIIVAGAAVGMGAVSAAAFLIPEAMGTVFGRWLAPGGDSTPRRREYSRPQALAAGGNYLGAVTAYRAAALEAPEDPEPLVQAARLLRDHLADLPEAARHFREARDRVGDDAGRSLFITRELAELWLTRSNTPRKALPELARMAGRFPGHPEGKWAARELAALKLRLFREEDGGTENPAPSGEGEGSPGT